MTVLGNQDVDFKELKKRLKLYKKTIGELFTTVAKERGVEQCEIAKVANVSPSTISRIFSGKIMFNLPLIVQISEILDIPFGLLKKCAGNTINHNLKRAKQKIMKERK